MFEDVFAIFSAFLVRVQGDEAAPAGAESGSG